MTPSYAVVWKDVGSARSVGKLEVEADALRLSGAVPGSARVTTVIPRDRVEQADLATSSHLRLDGRPTVLLRLLGGDVVRLASLDAPGTVHEIIRRIGAARPVAAVS